MGTGRDTETTDMVEIPGKTMVLVMLLNFVKVVMIEREGSNIMADGVDLAVTQMTDAEDVLPLYLTATIDTLAIRENVSTKTGGSRRREEVEATNVVTGEVLLQVQIHPRIDV